MGRKIVIVGGGAASVSALYQIVLQLIQENKDLQKQTSGSAAAKNKAEVTPDQVSKTDVAFADIEIEVIHKDEKFGPGLAYQTKDQAHILNLSKDVMSPVLDKPRDFADWVKQNLAKLSQKYKGVDFENDTFLPRAVYGKYLKAFAKKIQDLAKENHIKLTFRHDEVTDIVKVDDHFDVKLSSKNSEDIHADKVVLSIGHLESDNYREFKPNDAYFHSPWPSSALADKIKTKYAPVFIAGTRLTAIDAALSLKANGHQGRIILGSRLGLLPAVIGKVEPYDRKFFTHEKIQELTGYGTRKISLDTLFELFAKELNEAERRANGDAAASAKAPYTKEDMKKFLRPQFSGQAFLRRELAEIKEGKSRPWQNVLFSLYNNISLIWNALSDEGKKEFLHNYYSTWMTYLAAFPEPNARKMQQHIEEGDVEVKGHLTGVKYNDDTQDFSVFFGEEEDRFDYVINATGAGHDITKASSPLVKNMLARGTIVPYELGGIDVDFTTLQPRVDGEIIDGLFILGDGGTHGICMATADLGQVSKQAERAINILVSQVKHEMSLTKSPDSLSEVESRNARDLIRRMTTYLKGKNTSALTIQEFEGLFKKVLEEAAVEGSHDASAGVVESKSGAPTAHPPLRSVNSFLLFSCAHLSRSAEPLQDGKRMSARQAIQQVGPPSK